MDKKHRIVVAGGRDFKDNQIGFQVLDNLTSKMQIEEDVVVICGEAVGADSVGKEWAENRGVEVESHPAEWDTHGKAAGHIRNSQMADRGTHLIAFWDGESKGTRNMIETAKKKGLTTRIIKYHTVTENGKTIIKRGWE